MSAPQAFLLALGGLTAIIGTTADLIAKYCAVCRNSGKSRWRLVELAITV
jgi:hypothetical protein